MKKPTTTDAKRLLSHYGADAAMIVIANVKEGDVAGASAGSTKALCDTFVHHLDAAVDLLEDVGLEDDFVSLSVLVDGEVLGWYANRTGRPDVSRAQVRAFLAGVLEAALQDLRVDYEGRPTFDVNRCRVCGCTDDDCSGCFMRTGEPCHWVEDDLCSACAGRGEGPCSK